MQKISKAFLDNGVVIAIASFVGYLLTVSFHAGKLYYYKVPLEFLNVDIGQVILTVIILALVVMFIYFILISIIDYFSDILPLYKFSWTIASVCSLIYLLIREYLLLNISDSVDSAFFIILCVITFVVPTIYLLIKYRTERGFKKKLHARKIKLTASVIKKNIGNQEYQIDTNKSIDNPGTQIVRLSDLLVALRKIENPSKSVMDCMDAIDMLIKSGFKGSDIDISELTGELVKTDFTEEEAKEMVKDLITKQSRKTIFHSNVIMVPFIFAFVFILLVSISYGIGTFSAVSSKYYWESYKYKGYMFITVKNDVAVLKEYYDGLFTDNMLVIPMDKLGDLKKVKLR